jgi:GT2 family glycosyltransferase
MASATQTRTCAVVLNWKDTERTVRCLAELLASDSIAHVFVVDNESSGELRERLELLRGEIPTSLSLIELSDNRGFAGGINSALLEALAAGFDSVLAVNNDAVIDAVSVAVLVDALDCRPDLGLVAPRILHSDGSEESAGGFLNPWLGTSSHSASPGRAPDFITWACVLVRVEALRDVGLLSEEFFMYWEDVDMSFRLRAAGWKLEICSEAVLVHEVSSNRTTYPVAIKAYHTWSGLVFARKYRGKWLVGGCVWLLISAAMNVARGRLGALRGLQQGILLAREKSIPAYLSPRRKEQFGD